MTLDISSLPLVSVCIPTHNDGDFLTQSLKSVIGQTYPYLEILVGDDASTDNTAEIVRPFDDKRVHYHRNPANLGQFANVNAILSRASGKYVAVYHADDIYEPEIVHREVEFLETHQEAGAVFALDRLIDHEGRVFGARPMPKGIQPGACLDFAQVMDFLLRYKNQLLCAPTFMGRAEVLRRVGLFDTTEYDIASDLEMWLRILTVSKVAVLGEYLMRYRRSSSQVSSRYNYLRTFPDHYFAIMERYLVMLQRQGPVDAAALLEHEFHCSDDETFRAANQVILGNPGAARDLLRRRFPMMVLFHEFRRRKLRVLLLRIALRTGLATGTWPILRGLLLRTEYPGPRYHGLPGTRPDLGTDR